MLRSKQSIDRNLAAEPTIQPPLILPTKQPTDLSTQSFSIKQPQVLHAKTPDKDSKEKDNAPSSSTPEPGDPEDFEAEIATEHMFQKIGIGLLATTTILAVDAVGFNLMANMGDGHKLGVDILITMWMLSLSGKAEDYYRSMSEGETDTTFPPFLGNKSFSKLLSMFYLISGGLSMVIAFSEASAGLLGTAFATSTAALCSLFYAWGFSRHAKAAAE